MRSQGQVTDEVVEAAVVDVVANPSWLLMVARSLRVVTVALVSGVVKAASPSMRPVWSQGQAIDAFVAERALRPQGQVTGEHDAARVAEVASPPVPQLAAVAHFPSRWKYFPNSLLADYRLRRLQMSPLCLLISPPGANSSLAAVMLSTDFEGRIRWIWPSRRRPAGVKYPLIDSATLGWTGYADVGAQWARGAVRMSLHGGAPVAVENWTVYAPSRWKSLSCPWSHRDEIPAVGSLHLAHGALPLHWR